VTAATGILAEHERQRRRLRLSRASLRRNAGVVVPGVLLSIFFVAGVFAPLLAPQDPELIVLPERLIPPAWQDGGSWDHPFGTDNLGRDILSRLIYGARISLIVVAITIPISASVGTLAGVFAGMRPGLLDRVLMRVVDVQLAMPAILFAILLAAVFGPSLRNVILIITIWTWSGYARLVRGETLSLRERDFVTAARAIGARDSWIVLRHIVPNVLNAVVILATLEVAQVILIEASLSFLGVGVGLGTPSWGAMVSEGRNFMTIAWWLVGIPGIAILLVSLSGNLAGDWLRDILDPRLRGIR
jgi:peptide/nickel transport system permease protein